MCSCILLPGAIEKNNDDWVRDVKDDFHETFLKWLGAVSRGAAVLPTKSGGFSIEESSFTIEESSFPIEQC